jgi:hypothetical protein
MRAQRTEKRALVVECHRAMAKRRRAVTRSVEMRNKASLDRSALVSTNIYAERMQSRALKAEERAEAAEFELSDVRGRLAAVEMKENEAETHYAPLLDKKQARIVQLENELIELRSGGRIKMALAYSRPTVGFGSIAA